MSATVLPFDPRPGIEGAIDKAFDTGVRQGILACAQWLHSRGEHEMALALVLHSAEIREQAL